jgi:UDP-GlcNAc:undecaprenyl-phosphate GlcNAc-1-phosphate transferase
MIFVESGYMTGVLIVFCVSFVLSTGAVRLVLYLSHKNSWYDYANERKIHSGNIPRLGGIGFATAFVLVAFYIVFFTGENAFSLQFLPVLLAILLVFVSGVYDDFHPMAPRYKLFFQFVAAFCVIIPGYTFHRIFYGDWLFVSELNWIRYPLTLLWIVGLTNAINFIDGLDGLAAGISTLTALTIAAIGFSFSMSGTATLLAICLAGILGGFLVFNAPFPKAKIFMGDGGSQFLGFTLALLPLVERQDSPAALPLSYAAALLAIPIFDTIAAVWRRIRDNRRIDSPDRNHVHHKLMNLKLSALQVDLVLCGIQIILGVLVYFAVKVKGVLALKLLGLAFLVIISFFTILHFLNRRFLRGPGK